MKKLILLLLLAVLLSTTGGASGKTDTEVEPVASTATATTYKTSEENMNITLTIGTQTFSATLQDNATTRALLAQFPLTVNMSELNGNEYYTYLDGSLPTASENPRTIFAGDIKLYGANCVVVFYKSFTTSYRYTDLGKISNKAGLLDALKASGGKVTFTRAIEKQQPVSFFYAKSMI